MRQQKNLRILIIVCLECENLSTLWYHLCCGEEKIAFEHEKICLTTQHFYHFLFSLTTSITSARFKYEMNVTNTKDKHNERINSFANYYTKHICMIWLCFHSQLNDRDLYASCCMDANTMKCMNITQLFVCVN